jgi:hypothetical protein
MRTENTDKVAAYKTPDPSEIPPESYELRDAVTRLLAQSGPDSFACGIETDGTVLVWIENRTFKVVETSKHGIVLRPLINKRRTA